MQPNAAEFKKWYSLLMESSPPDYSPHLFVAEKHNKTPHTARGAWSLDKNRITAEQAIKLMRRGFNISIAGMPSDKLLIVDVDDESAIDLDTLVPTLSVRSRSRTGSHWFYFMDRIEDKRNIAVPEVGEIRCINQYVIAAGSYVTTDPENVPEDQQELVGFYTVENSIPPTHITFNQLPIIFRKQYIFNYLIPSIKDKFAVMARIFDDEPIHTGEQKRKSGLFDLEIKDIMYIPRDKKNFTSIFHGSKNGKNSTYSDGLLHCFRCNVYHTAITSLAVMAGIATCSSAGHGHKYSSAGTSTIDMRDGATSYRIWSYAREQGYIPRSDTPPRSALNWFSTETGLCREDEIINGYLPDYAYFESIRLLRTIP
jgi:hypothetical protein